MTFYDLTNTGTEIQDAITKALKSVDIDSSQTISGVKNFTNGIQAPILSIQLTDANISLYQYIENLLDLKVNKVSGKGLSTNDFTNYYKGTITSLMNGVATLTEEKLGFVFADELPSASLYANQKILYLIPSEAGSGYRDAYISNGSSWVQIGGAVDMSSYSTTAEMNAAIATAVSGVAGAVTLEMTNNGSTRTYNFAWSDLTAAFSANKPIILKCTFTQESTVRYFSAVYYSGYEIVFGCIYENKYYLLTLTGQSDSVSETEYKSGQLQKKLTFDTIPVENSDNPVTSGGVYYALEDKQDVITDLTTIRSGATAGATAYQKPSSGIPKTDLASAVQTSLGKADSALQTHQDISGKADVAALAGYTPTTGFATVNGSSITGGGNVSIVAAEGQTITIDATPTSGSSNAVSSGGVFTQIDGGFYY